MQYLKTELEVLEQIIEYSSRNRARTNTVQFNEKETALLVECLIDDLSASLINTEYQRIFGLSRLLTLVTAQPARKEKEKFTGCIRIAPLEEHKIKENQ